MSYKHIFGPVPSRRFGRSLGVDLVPYKTCSFDCVFCQLGRTTNKTFKRCEYIDISKIVEELKQWMRDEGQADFITLSGSGEPTLNSEFYRIIEFVKSNLNIPCLVLTNGSTLFFSEVRKGLCLADCVKVSFSCWDNESFFKINRPHNALSFDMLVEGGVKFREEYKGRLMVEVFLIKGLNDSEENIKKVSSFVERIKPDKIHLNTAVRPTAEPFVEKVSGERLNKLNTFFKPKAEVIAEFSSPKGISSAVTIERILNILKRRPCTIDQMCDVLNIQRNEIVKYIDVLIREKRISSLLTDGVLYYHSLTE